MNHCKFLFLLLLLIQLSAKAQNFFSLLGEGDHILTAGLQANPHLNFNADYFFVNKMKEGTFERFGIITQATFPLFSQKGFDFDFQIGAGALLHVSNRFKALTGFTWNLSKTADLNGKYLHSGFKLDMLPGYFSGKWMFAPHFSFSYQPFIHIKHSDYAKKAFSDLYPNANGKYNTPRDGWFYQNNLTLQTGFGIAYLQPKWHLNFTAGFQHQPNRLGLIALPDVGIMPFYGGINFGYSLNEK